MASRTSVYLRRPVIAWALYDWANSAFALAVITAFVPVMLAGPWNDGAASTVTTFRLGLTNGLSSLAVVLIAPLIGAITDQAGHRKRWVAWFTFGAALCTASLCWVPDGGWLAGLALFVLASSGFFAANSLYDAMLMDVAQPEEYDRVSAYGFGLGYLGGALLFLVAVLMVADPPRFGLAGGAAAMRVAFLLVAGWWVLFSLPLLLWVRERGGRAEVPDQAVLAGFAQLRRSLAVIRGRRNLLLFLVAYWLYIDGVYTIIKMAVDYGLSRGLSAQDVTFAILITNFIGFPAALAFGHLGERWGPKTGIYIALAVYIGATTLAVFLTTTPQFYGLAVAIGLVQGGVQSLSRSLYARLVPVNERGEYFGLYNMLGKFSSVLGPVLTGTATLLAGSQRAGILSILVLFVAGLMLLSRVVVPPMDESH